MADPNVVANPSSDPSFMSASPEDRHSYMMATNPDYASASPDDQKGYLQHLVTEGAKQNIAKYPSNTAAQQTGELTPEQYTSAPKEQQHTFEHTPRNLTQEVGQALPESTSPIMKGLGAFDKYVSQPLNRMSQAGHDIGSELAERAMFNSQPPALGKEPAPFDEKERAAAEQEYPMTAGISRAVGGTLGGIVADPRQVALMIGSMGSSEALPLLNKVASAGFTTQMGMAARERLGQLITNWDSLSPVQRSEEMTSLGIDTAFTALSGSHTIEGAPDAVGNAVKPVVERGVRMAGHGIENASRPIVAGPAIGGALGSAVGHPAAGAGVGEVAAMLHPRPLEPMIRVPKMTQYGLPKEVPPPFSEVGDVSKDVFNPEQQAAPVEEQKPVDKGLETLKVAYDKANSQYQKAYEAREAYRTSIDQGVEPPVAVQKAFDKAQKALDEAQFHYETAVEGRKNTPAQEAQPEPELTNPPVVRGGQQDLPGGGKMGKPLQLKGEVPTEAPEHANVPDLRARMVPAKEAAGEYEQQPEQPAMARQIETGKTNDQVKRIGDLSRQGLGGTELVPNKPLKEQLPATRGEVLPPEQTVAPIEPKTIEAEVEHPRNLVHANGEALANVIPKNAEGRELLQKLHNLSNVDLRQLAINAGEDMGQSRIGRGKNAGDVSRPEVFERLLKNHSAEDLGRMVDEGKHQPTTGEPTPPAPAEAKAEEPAPTGKINEEAQAAHEKYNEQKKYAEETFTDPEEKADYLKAIRISRDSKLAQLGQGGGATAAPEHYGANTEEAVAKENDWFDQAKKEKPDASVSEQLQYAQELKNKAQEHPAESDTDYATRRGTAIPGEETKFKGVNPAEKLGTPEEQARINKAMEGRDAKKADLEGPKQALDKANFKQVPHEEYITEVKNNPQFATLSDPESMKNNKVFSNGKGVYYSISPEGDLQGVINNSGKKGALKSVMPNAIANGAKTLDAWDIYLPDKYEKYGFERTNKIPYDVETYGNPPQDLKSAWKMQGWKDGDPYPAVQYMKLKENTPKASMETARMGDEELAQHGFTSQDIEAGQHLPAVSGGTSAPKKYKVDETGEPKNYNFYDEFSQLPYGSEIFSKMNLDVSKEPKWISDGVQWMKDHPDDRANALQDIKNWLEPQVKQGNISAKKILDTIEKVNLPKASMETARMSDEELVQHGFTTQDIEEGKHLPAVSGSKIDKSEAKELADEHLSEEEKAGIKTDVGRKNLIKNLMRMPSVQEFTDIAKAGESGRKWYQRSAAAFDALTEAAPDYFKDGDRQKFTDFLAALSPQQSVKMNLQEALSTWSKYVDMGRPEGKPLEKMLTKELTLSGAKVPNAMRALAGEDMWPDLSNNRNFKVPSFSKNLKGFMDKVTNDGWQAAFAGIEAKDIQTAAGYHPLAVVTRAAAQELGWKPAEAQAAIWAFTKTLTEEGNKAPEKIRQYSEDFADLMAHDQDIRRQLTDLGIDTGALDERLKQIDRKPEVTTGASPTAENSVGKLAKRLEKLGRNIPESKDSGLFQKVDADERENFFKSSENEDTSFNPDELNEVTPKATDKTARMSTAELLEHGFTHDDIDEGKHLPSVSGGSQDTDKEESPIWYSKAAKIAEEKLGGKASGAQILATLKNNGVKGDELEHTGLDDFLTGPGTEGQKFSKQDVLSYIKDNGIKLNETMYGEVDPKKEEAQKLFQEAQDKAEKAGEKVGEFRDEIMTLFHSGDRNVGPTSVWDLMESQGSQRERLLSQLRPTPEKGPVATQTSMFEGMPERAPKGVKKPTREERYSQIDPMSQENYDKITEALKKRDIANEEYHNLNKAARNLKPNSYDENRPKFENWTVEGPKQNYKEKLIQVPVKEGERPFVHASHFNEPNIVAHARYDDRVDADGKKNLFLEELQSDMHRTGAERGYNNRKGLTAEHRTPENEGSDWVIKKNGKEIDSVPHWYSDAEQAIDRHLNSAIHDAPFKNDWHEMALKRMLREAAEKGYDRMSWTTGKQQADRYSLSKQVDRIDFDPETKRLIAYKDGRQLIDKYYDDTKDMAGDVGKEIAEKLLSSKTAPPKVEVEMDDSDRSFPYKVMVNGEEYDRYSTKHRAEEVKELKTSQPAMTHVKGVDLEMGGSWAKALYDRAIPNFLNKYLKKFNIKVGETHIPGKSGSKGETFQDAGTLRWHNEGSDTESYATEAEAKAAKEAHTGMKVHSIDITPEMKKEFMKGQPIAEMEEETPERSA